MFHYNDFGQTHFLDALAAHYKRRGFQVNYEPFTQVIEFLPILAGTTDQQSFTVDADADFVICQTTVSAFTTAGASVNNPNSVCELKNESTGRLYQSVAQHVQNLFGTGERPFLWYCPEVLASRTTISLLLTNLSVNDMNLRFSFIGVKAFLANI